MSPRRTSEAVAETVRQALTGAGYTQEMVANATGIPQPTLSRRLNGFTPFTISELDGIAALLEIATSDLIARAERDAA